MSIESLPATAQILDFEAFRRRRQSRAAATARREFLWSWPASGYSLRVEFPRPAPVTSSLRSRFI